MYVCLILLRILTLPSMPCCTTPTPSLLADPSNPNANRGLSGDVNGSCCFRFLEDCDMAMVDLEPAVSRKEAELRLIDVEAVAFVFQIRRYATDQHKANWLRLS